MFINTRAYNGEQSQVHYMNGIVKLGPVQLNVYAYVTDGLLIDTGASTTLDQFKLFFDAHDFDQVVLTHHHEDHTGGVAYIQDRYDLPVFMHGEKIEECCHPANYPLYRKLFWGARAPFQASPIGSNFYSARDKWTVIETPGHASDHLAFLNEEKGQLFSGDLYVHPETKIILRNERISQIIQSIETVLTYDFEEMFCSHAGYIEDGKAALQAKLQYLRNLQEQVLSLHEKGWTEQEIHRQLFPKNYPISYFSLGEWHSKHIIRSILRG